MSIGQNGFNNNGNTTEDPISLVAPPTARNAFEINSFLQQLKGPSTRLISDDGSYVFFESTMALTPKALDHVESPNRVGLLAENVYEWHDGEISLLSSGRDRAYIGSQNPEEQTLSVHLIGTTPSGADVLFTTADQLVPADSDKSQDIYDARVDGGFREGLSVDCEGESCQGPAAAAPSTTQPGSNTFTGPGNTKSKKKHHKKTKKKHHKSTQEAV